MERFAAAQKALAEEQRMKAEKEAKVKAAAEKAAAAEAKKAAAAAAAEAKKAAAVSATGAAGLAAKKGLNLGAGDVVQSGTEGHGARLDGRSDRERREAAVARGVDLVPHSPNRLLDLAKSRMSGNSPGNSVDDTSPGILIGAALGTVGEAKAGSSSSSSTAVGQAGSAGDTGFAAAATCNGHGPLPSATAGAAQAAATNGPFGSPVGVLKAVAGAGPGGQQQQQPPGGMGAFGGLVTPLKSQQLSLNESPSDQQSQNGPAPLATLVSIDAEQGVRAVIVAAANSGSSRRSGGGAPPALAPIQEGEAGGAVAVAAEPPVLLQPLGAAGVAKGEELQPPSPPPAAAALAKGVSAKSSDAKVADSAANRSTAEEGTANAVPSLSSSLAAAAMADEQGGHAEGNKEQQGESMMTTPRGACRSSSSRESRTPGDRGEGSITRSGSRRASLDGGKGRTPRERASADGVRTPRVVRGIGATGNDHGSILQGVQSEPSSPRGTGGGSGSGRSIHGGYSGRGLVRGGGHAGESGRLFDDAVIEKDVRKVLMNIVDKLVLEYTS